MTEGDGKIETKGLKNDSAEEVIILASGIGRNRHNCEEKWL